MTSIYSEIKQKKRFARLEREVAVALLRTGDVERHAVERALAPWKISPEQYNVLRILRGAGPEGLPTLEVAARMISRSPNITRLLDKLVEKALVKRHRSEEDRRLAVVSLKAEGMHLLDQLDGVVDDVVEKFGCLTRNEMRELVGLLDRLRGHLAVKTVKEENRKSNPQGVGSRTLR